MADPVPASDRGTPLAAGSKGGEAMKWPWRLVEVMKVIGLVFFLALFILLLFNY